MITMRTSSAGGRSDRIRYALSEVLAILAVDAGLNHRTLGAKRSLLQYAESVLKPGRTRSEFYDAFSKLATNRKNTPEGDLWALAANAASYPWTLKYTPLFIDEPYDSNRDK